ncbi:YesL family protein [Vagococcus hydrophili]|uniref:YesL family protein n=1 Tax=Vagococcus hydrophili TaxID=2714947 RepID=A0A6G8AV12_9ENTE|nr:YesL family protein [Vagococcus hydrophili]QIL48753.1 YesL family protein [Vagococcus hydrophili]
MKNILSIDGWYFRVFSKLANLVLLNLIFVVSIIPVVTIGPAFIALILSLKELKEDGTLAVARVYGTHFKDNFKKGLILSVIELLAFLLPSSLIYVSLQYIPLLSTLLMILFSFGLLLLVIFPLIYSLKDVTIKQGIHLTLEFVTVRIAYAIACFIVPAVIGFISLKYSIIFLVLVGIATSIYLQLHLLEKGGLLDEN